jgi:dTDP-4-dehydrorhamnose reductase
MYDTSEPLGSVEEDIQIPRNTYARAKLISEDCLKIHENSLVIRTNFVSGDLKTTGHFISWLLHQYKNKCDIPLFYDYICSSIDTSTLCRVTQLLINLGATGIVNVGASHGFSKYELGVSILKGLDLSDANVKKVSMFDDEKNLMLNRYHNLTMNCDKLISNYQIELPDMDKVSENLLEELKIESLENKI